MSLSATLAAWWSAWRWVAILALVCLLLAALNVWQWKRAITADLRAENRGLDAALDQANKIAARRNKDDRVLLSELEAIAERGQRVRVEYETIIKDRPLPPQCAPGQERVDAVNAGLSGSKPE